MNFAFLWLHTSVYCGLTLCRHRPQGYSKTQILKPTTESHPTVHRAGPKRPTASRAFHNLTLASCSRIIHHHSSHDLQRPGAECPQNAFLPPRSSVLGWAGALSHHHRSSLPGQAPWRGPLILCMVTRAEAAGVLGSGAQPASRILQLRAHPPWLHASSPVLWTRLLPLSLPSPTAGKGFPLGVEDASQPHVVCFHPGGAEMGNSPWVYVSFLLQASTGATRRDSADGGTRKVLAECRLGPWPPVLFCLSGGKGSDSQLPSSDNRTHQRVQ